MLDGKKILLAVTGGIAAYKAAELCRVLCKSNADVRVVMTQATIQFVNPLTFQALSGNQVHTELLDPQAEAGMGHIELAKWPDLIVIAPASANFLASYSAGLANDLLSTLLLASDSPVLIAPAMNQAMWRHPMTQRNINVLEGLLPQVSFVGPQSGEQACGDVGPGRMSEPEDIAAQVLSLLTVSAEKVVPRLAGLRVVITAGPTREALDPVRYITNHSSGKMGFALATAYSQQGADVVLISGPVTLNTPKDVKRRDVVSAYDMYQTVNEQLESGCDIFIAAAAVADYRAAKQETNKIKKQGDNMAIDLVKNPDIVAAVASSPSPPFTVGFAAETNNVLAYAQTKLDRKKLDMIIANDVSLPGIGFNSDENEVMVISSSGVETIQQQAKTTLATEIVALIMREYNTENWEKNV